MTLAWHFVGSTLRDGRPVPADGVELRHDGPIGMCKSGLHASTRLIDALLYAPGSTVCRVECSEIEDRHEDKFVCRSRTILWRVDAESLLRDFARRCALDVVHLWDAPDIVLRYLRTGEESLRSAARDAAMFAPWAAARSAAWYAARSAAWYAATDAARAAAWAAARSAAWYAATDAERYAAWAAAKDAAWAAALAAKNRRLTAMASAARRQSA